MKIKYTCSLGNRCQTSQLLKNNKLKNVSYPFDWVFSNCNIILHCLEDDFKIFLDKSYYNSIHLNVCEHTYYYTKGCGCNMFNHKNPLDNENDYNYYIRCVDRFKKLLKYEELKLFIMIFDNMDNIEEKLKNDVIDFNNTFSKYTKNYKLLVIFHIQNKKEQNHIFTHYSNIDFLELHTFSSSGGVNFDYKNDNDYLNNIILEKYDFNFQN